MKNTVLLFLIFAAVTVIVQLYYNVIKTRRKISFKGAKVFAYCTLVLFIALCGGLVTTNFPQIIEFAKSMLNAQQIDAVKTILSYLTQEGSFVILLNTAFYQIIALSLCLITVLYVVRKFYKSINVTALRGNKINCLETKIPLETLNHYNSNINLSFCRLNS